MRILIIIILFLASNAGRCQKAQVLSPIDFNYLVESSATGLPDKHSHHYFNECTNGLQVAYTTLFVVYKEFFSSQDGRACTFSPSCSVYAIETVKKRGLLGFADAIDRLTRCNGLSSENYEIDQENHLFIDKP